jgi:hypothetical protein
MSEYTSSLPMGDRVVVMMTSAQQKRKETIAFFFAFLARMLPLSWFTSDASLRLATVLYSGFDRVGALRHAMHVRKHSLPGTAHWIHSTALFVVAASGISTRERAFDARNHAHRAQDELLRMVHETEPTPGNRIALITGFLACAYRAHHYTIPGDRRSVMQAYRPMVTRARSLVTNQKEDHHYLDTMALLGLPAVRD